MDRFFLLFVALVVALSGSAAAAVTKNAHPREHRLPPSDRYYADACADHWGVPRELMRAIMIQESGENPRAVSDKNARGLMQLMPGTVARYGVDNVFSPSDNACGAAHFLSDLIREFGDFREVVAAYYCGARHIKGRGLKYSNPSVIAYVRSVHALYNEELKEDEVHDEVASR